jgi:hypothetical protein
MRSNSLRLIVLAAWLGLPTVAGAVETVPSQTPFKVAQGASSRSGWKSICETRGPGCDAKMNACLKSGCWTEGAQYGGTRHCGLAKK